MNQTLAGLLVFLGLFGGTPYWYAKQGTTRADLVAAGITSECNQARQAECTFLNPVSGKQEQRRFNLAIGCNNPDGGTEKVRLLPPAFRYLENQQLGDVVGQCEDLGAVAWASATFAVPAVATSSCACRANDGGVCTQTSDGGVAPAATVMLPGAYSGTSCIPTPCHPYFGQPAVVDSCL